MSGAALFESVPGTGKAGTFDQGTTVNMGDGLKRRFPRMQSPKNWLGEKESVFEAFDHDPLSVAEEMVQDFPWTNSLTPERVAAVVLVAVQVQGSQEAVMAGQKPVPVMLTVVMLAVLLVPVVPERLMLQVVVGMVPDCNVNMP